MNQFLKVLSAGRGVSCAVAVGAALSVGAGRLRQVEVGQHHAASVVPSPHGADPGARVKKEKPVMVVELFTSESCPECPPAEDSLVAISRAAGKAPVTLIPLSFHVAYWNQDGWVDPFSDSLFTRRQHGYDGRQLYTPQGVVNGVTTSLSTSILQSPAPMTRAVAIESSPKGAKRVVKIRVAAPSSPAASPADSFPVYLAITEDSIKTHVTAGENKGHDFTHMGVVRYFQRVGTIGAGATVLQAVEVPQVAVQHGHLSVLVQSEHDGRLGGIVGAATKSL